MSNKPTYPTANPSFPGFDRPEANFFRLPNNWTDISAGINNIAELKVVEYILRHTWGFQEFGIKKRITIDEFMRGRRHQDGTRMDRGTGLSEMSVRNGIQKALEDGLIEEEVDASDKGRIKKYYSVRMRDTNDLEVQSLDPRVQDLGTGVQELGGRGITSRPRTEKETIERNLRKEIYPSNLRKAEDEKNDDINPAGSTPNPYTVEHPMARNDEEPPLQESTTKSNEAKARGSRKSNESADFQHQPQSHTVQTTTPPREETHKVQTSGTAPGGFTSIREMLPQQYVPQPIPDDEARDALRDYMRDIGSKLHDEAPLEHSTTRAFNLYQRSGLDLSSFFNRLYDAEKEANRRSTTITKRSADGFPNRMAYFFAVLEDKLGLKPYQPAPAHTRGQEKP